MARQYEIVYIFDSSLEEAQVNERLERLHELLRSTDYPQPVTSVNHWGRRTLAYPIHNKDVGYYVVTQFETDATVLPEFERALKLDDSVLRYLLVLNEGVTAAAPVGADSGDDEGDDSLSSEEDEA